MRWGGWRGPGHEKGSRDLRGSLYPKSPIGLMRSRTGHRRGAWASTAAGIGRPVAVIAVGFRSRGRAATSSSIRAHAAPSAGANVPAFPSRITRRRCGGGKDRERRAPRWGCSQGFRAAIDSRRAYRRPLLRPCTTHIRASVRETRIAISLPVRARPVSRRAGHRRFLQVSGSSMRPPARSLASPGNGAGRPAFFPGESSAKRSSSAGAPRAATEKTGSLGHLRR